MHLEDVSTSLHQTDAGLILFREQEIPQDFLDSLKSQRLASRAIREGEFHQVASVPAEVWDMWTVRGLDPDHMSAREIVAKLKADHLDAFITTAKSL